MSEQDKIPNLPITDVSKLLSEEELPNISVLIPCYLRRKFKPLMLCNLRHMNYPKNKIEVVILQDGPEDLFISKDEVVFMRKIPEDRLEKRETNLLRWQKIK